MLAATDAPNTAAANQNAALGLVIQNGPGDGNGVVRIVDRIGRVRSDIKYLVAHRHEFFGQSLLQFYSGMIGAYDKVHILVFAISSFAAETIVASGVKPNFFCSSLSGAEAPKVVVPSLRVA